MSEYCVSNPFATGACKTIHSKELIQELQKIQSTSLNVLLTERV